MAASSNILIVDDDPDIRQVLKILLSETYTVAEASSGTEAVAYVKEHPELALDNDNLISLCVRCHNIRHGRVPHKFKRKKKLVSRERW